VKGARGYSEMILQKMLYKHGTELLQRMEMRHIRITKYEHSKHEHKNRTCNKYNGKTKDIERKIPKSFVSRPPRQGHLLAGSPPITPHFFTKIAKKLEKTRLKK